MAVVDQPIRSRKNMRFKHYKGGFYDLVWTNNKVVHKTIKFKKNNKV